MLNPSDIQKYIGTIHFPADKTELVQQAEAHGAPKEMMDFFERIPERTYENPQAVAAEATDGPGDINSLADGLKDRFKL